MILRWACGGGGGLEKGGVGSRSTLRWARGGGGRGGFWGVGWGDGGRGIEFDPILGWGLSSGGGGFGWSEGVLDRD